MFLILVDKIIMKKYLFTIGLAVFLVGCTSVEEEEQVEIDVEEEPEVASTASYEQWAMPLWGTDEGKYLMPESMDLDCVGVDNGMTRGGDLLSSLIVDNKLRNILLLNLYTKNYIIDLEKKLASFTQAEYDSDFYAFSSCNMRDGMDLVSGYLWPQGTETTSNSFSYEDGILLFVNGDSVYRVDDSVRLLNQTATGAEVAPCEGQLHNDDIYWACFLGFAYDEGTNDIVGEKKGLWTLSPEDGSIVKYEDANYMQ